MIELLYQHACYVKFRYRFSCTTGIAIHTTWNSDHLTATSKLCIKYVRSYVYTLHSYCTWYYKLASFYYNNYN